MTYKAYTLNLGRNPQSVVTDIWVSGHLPSDSLLLPGDAIKCSGKWDTGCNMTCITRQKAAELKLRPYNRIIVKTPHGTSSFCETAKVALKIPNGQILPSFEVCVADMVDTDLLIGMDVISMGDFALSRNQYGEMIVSICMPPIMTIDLKPLADDVNNGNLKI